MYEVFRSRDLVGFVKGETQTVAVDNALASSGWPGGQGVRWTTATASDERVVTYSDGRYGGILIWGSDEEGDRFTSTTRQQPHYRYATLWSGGCLVATSSYERYTYTSRVSGPLVPLTYAAQDTLYLSLRGLWTNENELDITASLLGPAPAAGVVAQVPKALNRNFLGIQTTM